MICVLGNEDAEILLQRVDELKRLNRCKATYQEEKKTIYDLCK
jgi:hypothetical protein